MKPLVYIAAVLLLVGLDLRAVEAEEAVARIEVWRGCLCNGPSHRRTYEQLNAERTSRMMFSSDVHLPVEDAKLSALDFMKNRVGEGRFNREFRFHWMGAVYRKNQDGLAYGVIYRGSLSRFRIGDAKGGDVIVFYPEAY